MGKVGPTSVKPMIDLAAVPYCGHVESPLLVIARAAGFGCWADMMTALRSGVAVQVPAAEVGETIRWQFHLFRDACEAYGVAFSNPKTVGRDGDIVLSMAEPVLALAC